MDERWGALEGLHEVWLDGLLGDHRHGAGHAEVLGGDRGAGLVVAHDDATHTGPQVGQRGAQRQGGHDLRCSGDVEARLAGHAVEAATETDHDVAKGPLVDVHDPAPRDVVHVQAQFVAVEQVGVKHGRAHVVGRGDRMHVAGQVEVEQFHRHDLAVAATCCATFDPEGRAHRRLADGDRGLLADVAEALAKADGGCGLALAERCGSDGRDHHVLGFGAVGHPTDGFQLDLGGTFAVLLEAVGGDAGFGGDVGEGTQGGAAGNFEV